MQRRSLCWILLAPTVLGLAILGGRATVGQIPTRIGRAPGSYQGSSGSIRYGNSYVSDKWSVQSRGLPSQNRGARMADGYLPSENRYYRARSGALPTSGGRYFSPPRSSIRYQTGSRTSSYRSRGSVRYSGSYSRSASYGSRSSSQLGSRTQSYGSSSRLAMSRSRRGSLRYGR
jgi:hypothetical protein